MCVIYIYHTYICTYICVQFIYAFYSLHPPPPFSRDSRSSSADGSAACRRETTAGGSCNSMFSTPVLVSHTAIAHHLQSNILVTSFHTPIPMFSSPAWRYYIHIISTTVTGLTLLSTPSLPCYPTRSMQNPTYLRMFWTYHIPYQSTSSSPQKTCPLDVPSDPPVSPVLFPLFIFLAFKFPPFSWEPPPFHF